MLRTACSLLCIARACGLNAAWTLRLAPAAECAIDRAWTKTSPIARWWDEGDAPRLQTAAFCAGLWGLEDGLPYPETDEPAEGGDERVRVTVYDIGGDLKAVLGASACKEFPIIPHVGVRVRGVEHFYSDHVEFRASGVMDAMLPPDTYPRVVLDVGETTRTAAEVAEWTTRMSGNSFSPESYDLWECNCNHFAKDFAEFLLPGGGVPDLLMAPVLDFTDSMLDNVPAWRRAAGIVFMKQLSRFVVVSWGRVVRGEKERRAAALGATAGA